jgi:hypothetical protein
MESVDCASGQSARLERNATVHPRAVAALDDRITKGSTIGLPRLLAQAQAQSGLPTAYYYRARSGTIDALGNLTLFQESQTHEPTYNIDSNRVALVADGDSLLATLPWDSVWRL